ncbi:HNH nuclease domain-containing protein [Cupriavidus sp. H18C1]|uniref:HNH endonuclease n=1 Tax=Cupriavidus sp. H18C1 TaxID=3241601 RepID=UPI003BB8C07B
MIKIDKLPEPPVLVENSKNWTSTLLARIAAGERPTDAEKSRYRHAEIKAVLLEETDGKCAYCESKLRHIAYGDIEHITPKSTTPALSFEWRNLTLACDICNTNKSDFLGDHDTFVDPYSTDPTTVFFFAGPLLMARAACEAAAITERLLDLNRPELFEKRKEKIRNLAAQVEVYARTQDPDLKAVLRRDIEKHETSSDKEYAGLARQFLREFLEQEVGQ